MTAARARPQGDAKPVDTIVRVALPVPVARSFEYAVRPGEAAGARPGSRVLVPFGRRRLVGCILERREGKRGPKVRDVERMLDAEPALPRPVLDLCSWIASYYAAPVGLVVRSALPPGMLTAGDRPAGAGALRRRHLVLTRDLPTLLERERAFGRARRQKEAYETLEAMGGTAAVAHLERHLGFSRSVLDGLVRRGLAVARDEVVRRDPFAELPASPLPGSPTPDQARALEILRSRLDAGRPGVTLLRGVTGSGKTLVYLELLATIRERGGGAIVLVPEIALTPQIVSRFRAVAEGDVAVLHSGLSAGERADEWRALRSGAKKVAIGTRSAVFAPVRDLRLIVVDEEHDGSYKQSDTPRYHARAAAAVRARLEGALCVLGSATPSLESWANAKSGRYALVELPDRVTAHPLPAVDLVDLRAERSGPDAAGEGAPDDGRTGPLVLSNPLHAAILDRLDRGEQTVLLLNRRGYSTFLQCADCGWVAGCRRCNVSLTYHRRRARVVCHHCGFEESAPSLCPGCGREALLYSGLGTEQVERVLGEAYPAARIARMDVDTTGAKWAHMEIIERVRRREVDILLGTQMIAKGLDLPGVTLVGVINADVGLNLPDFRASERTFQLLAQVAGRAGRGERPGEVLVQTARPRHFALQAAVSHDYEGFAAREMDDRAGPGYPPHRRLANLVVSGPSETAVADGSAALADRTRTLVDQLGLEGLELLGPAPCPIDRLRGRWRWHLLVKSDRPKELGHLLRELSRRAVPSSSRLRLEIDRDPESLL
ncbi:MAG: primosomal protein N' [Gemmatimonadota bacterium]